MSIKGNLDQIKDILLSEKSYLKEKYFISNIGLFGSYTRGEQKNKSDLDILVEFSKPIDFSYDKKQSTYVFFSIKFGKSSNTHPFLRVS
ncbi:MAG: nucleotidyltransferase [Brevinematales bacterium]|nr:nucleotidyltransferase [Brevinematales bacterium]